MPELDFEKTLLDAVDWGLSTLGESSKSAVYFHLRETFNVRKEEIPRNVEAFADAMERIFGPGASFLELLIIRRLREKVQGAPRLPGSAGFTLAEFVAFARRDLPQQSGV